MGVKLGAGQEGENDCAGPCQEANPRLSGTQRYPADEGTNQELRNGTDDNL